ncbi:MAG: glycosyltransferase family 4 protein [Chloroflexota bacterium]
MKILLLNSEFPPIGGGAGNASANIARQLVTLGHEVLVLTVRHASLPHEETWCGVQIVRVPALRKHMDRSGLLEQVSFVLSGSLCAGGVLKKFPAKVVLAFFGVPSGPIAWLLRKLHGIPYIISMRGGDVPGFRPYDFETYHRLVAPFLRQIWKDAGSLVANSLGLQALALKFDPGACIELIPNGVDLDVFAPVVREWSPPRLLSVGRLVYQKGFDLAARALANLIDLDWEWTVVGDGTYRQEFEKICLELGIVRRVKLVGWRSKPDLIQHYNQANLFVFPSRHEGMPNAILEAMSSGLPVLASHIAGNEELVQASETGLLFPSESVADLQAALLELIPDAARRREMGEAGRNRVAANYSWVGVADRYTEVLAKMVKAD